MSKLSSNVIESEWKDFARKVYPDGTVPAQRKQLKAAFYSGAWVALNQASALSELPTEQAVEVFEAVYDECRRFCKEHVEEL